MGRRKKSTAVARKYFPKASSRMTDEQAQRAGEELQELADSYGFTEIAQLTTAQIVDFAKDNTESECHKHFDWNMRTAARKYWISQAGKLIRSIEIEVVNAQGEEFYSPAYISVAVASEDLEEETSTVYIEAEAALSEKEYREQYVEKAKESLRSWLHRFRAVKGELSCFKSIERCVR